MLKTFPSDAKNPQDWLMYAKADFYLGERVNTDSSLILQLRCFHLQQAVEKSMKAVLTKRGAIFPFTSNLDILMSLLKSAGIAWIPELSAATMLSAYASARLYPGMANEMTSDDYDRAWAIAQQVYTWAEQIINPL
jgi:HEPN domain-containing protein